MGGGEKGEEKSGAKSPLDHVMFHAITGSLVSRCGIFLGARGESEKVAQICRDEPRLLSSQLRSGFPLACKAVALLTTRLTMVTRPRVTRFAQSTTPHAPSRLRHTAVHWPLARRHTTAKPNTNAHKQACGVFNTPPFYFGLTCYDFFTSLQP